MIEIDNLDILKELVKKNEFEKKVFAKNKSYRKHPVKKIIGTLENPKLRPGSLKYAKYTLRAIINVKNTKNDWFKRIWEERIMDFNDNFNNVIGALGEIRTLYRLINSNFNVNIVKKDSDKSPDFEACCKEDKSIFIEVFTPRIKNEEEQKKSSLFQQEKKSTSLLDIYTEIIRPTTGETENIIHFIGRLRNRIVSNKKYAKQTIDGNYNILWVDLISDELNIKKEATKPYVSKKFKNNYITGNFGLWQSFYGEPKMKIIKDRTSLKYAQRRDFKELDKPGYFRPTNENPSHKWSGVIFAFTTGIVLYQNPWANIKLDIKTLKRMIRIEDFNAEYSWFSVNNENIKRKIKLTINECEEIYNLIL
ncbi:hypothetical protein [Halarsenatibacter silvermanii]|uniref:Uncharacterized protein n=1 Tax=Halarsenatibacter silvermanii TaxID=321763 RepID=A0A1G9R238_9FIRM|nr:hypothetical protein [Halarsenatibacter silvermanii]SDM17201.1 hypothetical protein SAMN04488692_11947 [Halarsenatibacter silvermanii]